MKRDPYDNKIKSRPGEPKYAEQHPEDAAVVQEHIEVTAGPINSDMRIDPDNPLPKRTEEPTP